MPQAFFIESTNFLFKNWANVLIICLSLLLLAFTIVVTEVSNRHSGKDHAFKKKKMKEIFHKTIVL
jgi:hypothetical protein